MDYVARHIIQGHDSRLPDAGVAVPGRNEQLDDQLIT
jgi:hypothetical protein